MITLKFDKLYNKKRMAQPCFVSVPLAKGRLWKADNVSLWQQEKCLPIQRKVLAKHADGSIKYLFLRFLADIPANKGAEVECKLEDGGKESPVTTLFADKEKDGFRVNTGVLEFRVSHGGTRLFEEVKAHHAIYTKEQMGSPVLKDEAGNIFHMQYGDWYVVEEGPVCVILSNKGRLVPEGQEHKGMNSSGTEEKEEGFLCETRLTAYAGKSYIETELRLINATEEAVPMTSWEYVLWMGTKNAEVKLRTCVASSNYKTSFLTSEEGETLEKSITAEYLLNESNEHFAETFYGTFFADYTTEEGGVCATVFQAQQNFPKALVASRDGIVIKLIPEGSASIVLQSGMAVKQRFQLYFHEAEEDLQEINHQSILYQMPDQPVLSPEVYEASGLFPDIFVDSEKQDSDVECALMMAADIHGRSYGMLAWGDAPDSNYTAQGRGQGRLVWTNNEYDYPHACMLQFARTGIRRFMDYCVVTGTHQRDVDICHYSKNELLQGGQWEHTKGHCENGVIVCSHQWVEGLLDCYHLTGDDRFLEAALGIGENVLRLLNTPEYQKTGGLNARETGWALRTLTALYKETYEDKWTEKCDWIVTQFKEWADTFGGWLAPYTDNTAIRVPFMISVAIGSLMRYYREFPREDIKKMILDAVDDMLANCMMDNGYFFYKELPTLSRVGTNPLVLEALAIAYELTGEKKYLEQGVKTFKNNVEGCLGGSFGMTKRITEGIVLVGTAPTKKFAQMYVPMATFYKALVE